MKGKLRIVFWFVVLGAFVAMLVSSRGPMRILFAALLLLWIVAGLFERFVRREAARVREEEARSKGTQQ